MLNKGATHGVAWADFDRDGDLDLALANNSEPDGTHPLYRNNLTPDNTARSLQVTVVDAQGREVRAGARVTLRAEGSDGSPGTYVSSRLVETGSGYASQSSMPVHFGLPAGVERVRLTVEWFQNGALRSETRTGVHPEEHRGAWLRLTTQD
jgi:hypothetical protein